jgi:triacylglycerol lipase
VSAFQLGERSVSTFVEIPPEQYSATAFANFNAAVTDLSIGNARAMMWMSQLAYETGQRPTIDAVAPKWGFSQVTPFVDLKTSVQGSFDTTGLLGERNDAIVLVFAGTDPGVWQTVATDGQAMLSRNTDTHTGFQNALNAAQDTIQQAVNKSQQTGKPLWIAGHSLGAALAALAAQFADSLHHAAKAVYLFGMPRTGGSRFQAAYNGNANLGPVSYRFVHGLDVVARVPPSVNGYRHIGRVLQCASGGKFDPTTSPLSALGSDDPQLSTGVLETLESGVENVLTGHLFSPPGPGTFGPFFKFLPQPIRDHLQDRYWTALTPAD